MGCVICFGGSCATGCAICGTAGAGGTETVAACASAAASIEGGICDGGRGGLLLPPRRGKPTIGSPFQSFHVSVARGDFGGLPVNSTSNTARFTSLPVLAVAM